MDIATMLIVGHHVSQNPNDKQEVAPALQVLSSLPDALGSIAKAATDSGYFSKDNTQQFEAAKIEPVCPIVANITTQHWKNGLPKRQKR